MSFSDDEIERYARHLVLAEIGGPGQQRLKAARVAIVGMGGVGALHLGYDPRKWQLLRDDQQVIPGPEQFVLYQRGDSQ